MPQETPSPPAAPQMPGPMKPPTGDERNLAVAAHLLGILTSFVGALIIWMMKKDSAYVMDQSREALNFQITMLVGYAVAGVTSFIVVGCFIAPVVVVVNLVFCILAAVAASRGERYRYPIALRLIS